MKKALTIIASGCMSLFITASAFSYEDGDWQLWQTDSISGKLTDNLKASAELEFRFGDDMSEFYYQHSQVALDYKINDMFSLGVAFREVYELNTKTELDDDWYSEHRPLINGSISWKWSDWKLKNRARVEFRNFEIKDNTIRFRNKIGIKSPWKWTALKINPYIEDEIFMEEHKSGIYRNRLYVGVGMELLDAGWGVLKGALYYLWQADEKDDEWENTNALGLKFKLGF